MTDFKQMINEDMRLAILQVLEQDPDYSHNQHIIKKACAMLGHNISDDQVLTQLTWLEEQQLITLSDAGAIKVAKLTARGEDVALGRARQPGVARKRPE